MSLLDNIITPIIAGVIFFSVIFWFFYLLIKLIKLISPDFFVAMKYKVLRKKWSDEAVNWCMEGISRGMTIEEAEKLLLVSGTDKKKIKETLYIWKNVEKKLKGGVKNEQLRQGNGKVKFPEIQ